MIDPLLKWIVGDKTGVSSVTIWAHFVCDCEPDFPYEPSDPSDFLRCYWLLKKAPKEWTDRICELGKRYPDSGWPKLTEHWDELTAMLEEAWPKSCATGEYENEPEADKMYNKMIELQKL